MGSRVQQKEAEIRRLKSELAKIDTEKNQAITFYPNIIHTRPYSDIWHLYTFLHSI